MYILKKRNYLFLSLFISLIMGSVSCSNSSKEWMPLELEDKSVVIYSQEIASVDIISGEGSYRVDVGDRELLDVSIVNDKIILMGKGKTGSTNLVLRDRKDQVAGLYVILSEKNVFWKVKYQEDQVLGDDKELMEALKDSLITIPYPVAVGGGYRLTYLDKDRGNLVVYSERKPAKLWRGTFIINELDVEMKYVEEGKEMKLNYIIVPDLMGQKGKEKNSRLIMRNIVLYDDWTSYFQGQQSLFKLDYVRKAQFVEVEVEP